MEGGRIWAEALFAGKCQERAGLAIVGACFLGCCAACDADGDISPDRASACRGASSARIAKPAFSRQYRPGKRHPGEKCIPSGKGQRDEAGWHDGRIAAHLLKNAGRPAAAPPSRHGRSAILARSNARERETA